VREAHAVEDAIVLGLQVAERLARARRGEDGARLPSITITSWAASSSTSPMKRSVRW
jgi:hypothetical protein